MSGGGWGMVGQQARTQLSRIYFTELALRLEPALEESDSGVWLAVG